MKAKLESFWCWLTGLDSDAIPQKRIEAKTKKAAEYSGFTRILDAIDSAGTIVQCVVFAGLTFLFVYWGLKEWLSVVL